MGFTATQTRLLQKAATAYEHSATDLLGWLRVTADMRQAGLTPSEAAPHVGVSARAIYNALRIVDYVEAARVSDSDVEKLGITRLALLAHQTRPEDYKAWRKEALSLTRRELERRFNGKQAPSASMVFVVSEKDRHFITRCLEQLGASVVSDEGQRVVMRGKDQAFVRMAREWRKNRSMVA